MMGATLKEFLRLCRIEYLGFSCVALFGALSVAGRALTIADAFPIIVINMLVIVWGFVHNDYCDIEYDRLSHELSERPLVKGSVSKGASLYNIFACVIVSFALAILCIGKLLPILALTLSFILASVYNLYSKKMPGSDFFYAASASCLCLFGALSALDNGAGIRDLGWLTWIIISIQFVDHLFFNIEGTLKDVEIDNRSGALTTPILLGVSVKHDGSFNITSRFKALFYSLKVITIGLVLSPFMFFDFSWHGLQMVLLIVMAIRALFVTKTILDMNQFDRCLIGHLSVAQEKPSKLMVPLMLFGHIGFIWMLFFIVTPGAWFLVCNYMINGKFIAPPKTY
jgi:4-hydroxybenzoate polyprenyltransferase